MKCVITLCATNSSGSARHRIIPVKSVELNWDEIPDDFKKYINNVIELKWRMEIENSPQD